MSKAGQKPDFLGGGPADQWTDGMGNVIDIQTARKKADKSIPPGLRKKMRPDEDPPSGWNLRYIAYCNYRGFGKPEECMSNDAERYFPGGKMAGFTMFIQSELFEFSKVTLGPRDPRFSLHEWVYLILGCEEADKQFDAWLMRRYPEPGVRNT